MDFNPHHREGGDTLASNTWSALGISIHTTAKVVTKILGQSLRVEKISIHTTAKVVTNIL